jgi:hypothetical protein
MVQEALHQGIRGVVRSAFCVLGRGHSTRGTVGSWRTTYTNQSKQLEKDPPLFIHTHTRRHRSDSFVCSAADHNITSTHRLQFLLRLFLFLCLIFGQCDRRTSRYRYASRSNLWICCITVVVAVVSAGHHCRRSVPLFVVLVGLSFGTKRRVELSLSLLATTGGNNISVYW